MIFEYDCEICGKHVRKQRSPANVIRPPRFCSQTCNGAAKRGSGRGRRVTHTIECERCGKRASVYRSPSARQNPRFCSLKCLGESQRGSGNPAFAGGRIVFNTGYVGVLRPDHPHADPRGYVLEHRLVMEGAIGRVLSRKEVVHHRDRNPANNELSNLVLCASQAEHLRIHREEDSR